MGEAVAVLAVIAVVVAVVTVSLLSPALSCSFDVGGADLAFGERLGVVVVTVDMAVVGGAFESAVELAGRPVLGVGDDVVDIAAVGANVAVRRVLASSVADLDRPP